MTSRGKLVAGFVLAMGIAGCSQGESTPASTPMVHAAANDAANKDPDERVIIALTPDQRLHVLSEMNQFLLSTQEIIEGLSVNDQDLVQSAVSDGLGRGPGQGQGLMRGALPPEFRQMGAAMKSELKKIGTLSSAGADTAAQLEQLSATLMYCQSCHASYQIRPADNQNLTGE